MPVRIRILTADDLDFAVAQVEREWRHGDPDKFATHLEHDPGGVFVACDGEERVGMVTTTRYETSGWVGNLIVVPGRRREGIGRALMERALDHLAQAGVRTIRLDGDPPGIPLYRKLGFRDEVRSLRYRRPGGAEAPAGSADSLTEGDLPEAVRLDRAAFGESRERLLPILFRKCDSAFAVKRGQRLDGFVLLQRTGASMLIGPCAASDEGVAADLIARATGASGGLPVRVGVLESNPAACRLLGSLGFEPTPPSLKMVLGEPRAESDAGVYFAIASGAFG